MEENAAENTLKDLPIQAENPAFAPGELIACAKCERTNPPTRLACFYCGAELEIGEDQIKNLKPNLRKLESWEKGFNLILSPVEGTFDEAKSAEIAKLLNLEREVLQKIFGVEKENHPGASAPPLLSEEGNFVPQSKEGNFVKALPLARAGTQKEAEIIGERLREFNVETFILSDEALEIEKPPVRLRALEFSAGAIILIFFNRDEIAEIAPEDLCLIVSGAIFERRLEATEKRIKKGDNKILQTTETVSDEFLIDVYTRKDPTGYRIFAKGFDFSCLEAEKEILAKDNLKKLARKLSEAAPNVRLIEDYLHVRENLGNVWEVEERKDSQGLKRQGFGRFNLGNVVTVNNSAQFTKYSRLQWHLL
jgi:hypothetical protein